MTLDPKDVELLIRGCEGLTTEFKAGYSSRIDEDVVAFANTKGGTILLGVRDDGAVAGEMLTNDLKARINSLTRNCKPALSVTAAQVGEVVVVEVPEGDEKPYGCGSGYFRRLDGTTQKMTHEEIRIMFRENDRFPFEERTARGFTFGDLSRAKVLAFTREAGIHIGKTSNADFLRSLKVADEDLVKNAGILFFAKEVHDFLPQARMTLIAFKGKTRSRIYDRRDVRGDLFTQFEEAILFLEKHLNVRSEIKGVDREDICEIPMEALREAVVNALMHRDYGVTGTQISVDVFDDRIEITNPGGLPKGLSQKALGKGVSIRRNERVADLFARLHKVERAGTGIQRMRESLARAGLKAPDFEVDGFFRTVFHRSPEFSLRGVVSKSGQISGQKKWSELAETQRAVLRAIEGAPGTSRKKLSESLAINPSAVQRHIHNLKAWGLLRRVGPDKGGHWEVSVPEYEGRARGVVRKGGQVGGQKKWSELTETQKAVLRAIQGAPGISRKKLSESLAINPSAVQRHIHNLKAWELLRRVGPDKGGYWEVSVPEMHDCMSSRPAA
ncbi:MAG: ATP-binding protein [Elusimicrobiota bacterium]